MSRAFEEGSAALWCALGKPLKAENVVTRLCVSPVIKAL